MHFHNVITLFSYITTCYFLLLQELVADPRSRKAQFMVSHLMSEQRSALAQRLDVLRNQPECDKAGIMPSEASQEQILMRGQQDHEREKEELQILGQIEALELATLSNEVLYQVSNHSRIFSL